jgi:hypothetical protein
MPKILASVTYNEATTIDSTRSRWGITVAVLLISSALTILPAK